MSSMNSAGWRGPTLKRVNVSSLMVSPDSGAVKPPANPSTTIKASATKSTVTEQGSSSGTILFTRTGDLTKSVTVYYATGGTATNGVDYTRLPGSLVMPAGLAATKILITPVHDRIREGNETVTLTISANALYTVGSPASATVTIIDGNTQAVRP